MNKYWLIAFLAWSLGLFGSGAYYQHRSDLAGEEALRVKAEQAAREQEHNQLTITSEVDHAYQLKKTAIDLQYDDVLNGLLAPAGSLPGLSYPAGKPDGARGDPVPAQVKRARVILIKKCDEQAQQLNDLQGWVRDQQKAAGRWQNSR